MHRLSVYCTRSAAGVTPDELLAGVEEADLHTIAECEGVPDDVIVNALEQLRVEDVEPGGFCFYQRCYREGGRRQVDVERWQTADEIRTAAAEALEMAEDNGNPAAPRVRAHLVTTVDIVDVSFGSSPDERIAPVLAGEVARWLAERFGGIVRDADDEWWELGAHRQYKPLRP